MVLIEKAINKKELADENVTLRNELSDRFSFRNIVAASPEMQNVIDLARKVAATDTSVLILGESGTGKELVARAIHFASRRSKKPFVTVNCSSIPDNLMESEMFGHVKGAFTGAIRDHEGKFERADGGTIFLDEIGDMKTELQAKLLRVLQEKEFEKVGGTSPVKVDVRVIAATNKNLDTAISEKTFREDLYFRVSVFPVRIPPLRERRKDVELLAGHFLKKYAPSETLAFDDGVVKILEGYHWPGNVRELENVMERAIVLKKGSSIGVDDLPPEIVGVRGVGRPIFSLLPREGISLDEFEKELLTYALEENDWNQSRAAKFLGITRHTLLYRIEKHGIKKPASHPETSSDHPETPSE